MSPRKHVFLILTAATEEWQIELRDQLFQQLNDAQLSWMPFIVRENYSWDEQEELCARVLARKREFDGGLLVATTWGPARVEALGQFASSFGKPLVFLDRNPEDAERIPPNVCYVSVSDARGGVRVADLFGLSGVRGGRVLVMAGNAKPKRVTAFASALRERSPDFELHTTLDGGFDRGQAAQVGFDLLSDAIKKRQLFDAIYAITDSMALGAVDAIDEVWQRFGPDTPKVFSYDGLPEIQQMIGTGAVEGTLIQDATAVACRAVDELIARLYQNGERRQMVWVPPRVFGERQNAGLVGTGRRPVSERGRELDGLLRAYALLVNKGHRDRAQLQRLLAEINSIVRRA
jgi:ABC-type sugar transport system substrate-binding protein